MWSRHGANPCRWDAPTIGACTLPGRLVVRASQIVGGLFAAYAAFYTTLLCAMAGSWRGMWLGKCSQELSRSALALRSLSVDRMYSIVM